MSTQLCVFCIFIINSCSHKFLWSFISGGHGGGNGRSDKIRVFRAEKSYAVTQGKWYFEFEAVTVGEMRVGWARPSVHADRELGSDDLAYVFNGFKVLKLLTS